MLPLLNYHSTMFLILSLNQRILTSNSSSLRLGFLLCLAISCTSCFICRFLRSPSTLQIYYTAVLPQCQELFAFFPYFFIFLFTFLRF